MKVHVIMVSFLVMAMVALTGCPPLVDMPVEVVVIDPVVAVLSTEMPTGMGTVSVSGSFSDEKSSDAVVISQEKANLNWNEIVSFFKPQVSWLEIYFFPKDTGYLNEGDPYPDGTRIFYTNVIDGLFSDEFLLDLGPYDIYIGAFGINGDRLFNGSGEVEVVADQTTPTTVTFYLVDYFNFKFVVNGLPGDYGDWSYNVAVTDGSGNQYYTNYFRFWPMAIGKADTSVIIFQALLPIDFDGLLDGGALIVTDLNGDTYVSGLDFNIFDSIPQNDYLGAIEQEYNLPDWLGGVDIDVDFYVY